VFGFPTSSKAIAKTWTAAIEAARRAPGGTAESGRYSVAAGPALVRVTRDGILMFSRERLPGGSAMVHMADRKGGASMAELRASWSLLPGTRLGPD
jgi:hypothetical protein